MAYWVVKVGSGNWVYKESGLPSKTTKKFEEHDRAENDPEGSHGKITTRVITPVYQADTLLPNNNKTKIIVQ